MHILNSICPACHHRFVPWSVWKITRWSCMECPSCHCKLNRAFQVREAAIWFGFFATLNWLFHAFAISLAVLAPVAALALYLVDICTVRLVKAEPLPIDADRRS